MQRELIVRSGAEWNNEFGVNCLLIAWLQGEGQMESFDSTGRKESNLNDGFGAIGSGRGLAVVAYRKLQPVKMSPEQKFGHIPEIAARQSPKCSLPCDSWKVSPSGIDENPYRGERSE